MSSLKLQVNGKILRESHPFKYQKINEGMFWYANFLPPICRHSSQMNVDSLHRSRTFGNPSFELKPLSQLEKKNILYFCHFQNIYVMGIMVSGVEYLLPEKSVSFVDIVFHTMISVA